MPSLILMSRILATWELNCEVAIAVHKGGRGEKVFVTTKSGDEVCIRKHVTSSNYKLRSRMTDSAPLQKRIENRRNSFFLNLRVVEKDSIKLTTTCQKRFPCGPLFLPIGNKLFWVGKFQLAHVRLLFCFPHPPYFGKRNGFWQLE